MEILIKGLLFPIKALVFVIDFIVWEFFSTGEWRTRRLRVTPDRILQDKVDELEATIAKMEREHSKSIDDLLMRHQKEVERLKKELRDRQR